MIQRFAPAFPEALDDDDDDVTWALQTAGVQWKRGAHADAIEWLHRAVESAVDGGRATRAREIQQQINSLEAALKSGWRPGPPPPPPPAPKRNPFLDDDVTEQAPFGELAVDIDVEPSFELRRSSRAPARTSSIPARASNVPARTSNVPGRPSFRANESIPAEEVSDAELIDDVEEFDDVDELALGAPRRPMVSAPELETGLIDDDDYLDPAEFPRREDEELPTLPPSVRDIAPSMRGRHATSPPRPPNLPPLSPSWPPPATSRPPSLPTPPPAWKQVPASSRPPPSLPPPPAPLSTSPSATAKPLSSSPPSSDAPPRQPRASRRPSARALALEEKIAAAKALARQRLQETEEEEPTERSLEAATPASNAPSSNTTVSRRISSYPPDTQVTSEPPPENFASVPADETTEREFEPLPPEIAPPSSARDRIPESEPGTSPDLANPFKPSDSSPPTEPTQEDVERRESSQPPTESDPLPVAPPTAAESEAPPAAEPSQPPASAKPPASAQPSQSAAPPASEPKGPRPTDIAGIELGSVPGLEDLPEESQQDLAGAAQIHTLSADEEVADFGLALVLDGAVSVMPAIADVAAARAQRGELIFSQGHLEDGVPIRVVASRQGAKVASFSAEAFDAAVRDCPWVGDELKVVGDRLQALAGVAMGPMGEELDDMLRGLVVERCEVRRLLPNEVIATGGKPVPGMVIVGAGRIELVDDAKAPPLEELGPGSFLYASQILQAAPAPHTARAGKEGALVLYAERKVAHELMVSVPPLLGIFAQ
ncbi:MAG: hypothetical protein QM756_06185 [Polyangiaceae bacterium]